MFMFFSVLVLIWWYFHVFFCEDLLGSIGGFRVANSHQLGVLSPSYLPCEPITFIFSGVIITDIVRAKTLHKIHGALGGPKIFLEMVEFSWVWYVLGPAELGRHWSSVGLTCARFRGCVLSVTWGKIYIITNVLNDTCVNTIHYIIMKRTRRYIRTLIH